MKVISPKRLLQSVFPTVRNGNIFNASSLDLQFARTKTLDSRITFTRASSGTYVDSQGVIRTATTNQARFDHNPTTGESLGLLVEEARTNSIRNNTMVGAVAGTPGTLPTNWVIQGGGVGTLTQQVVGTGIQNGINYIDIKYSGTTSTTDLRIGFEPSTQITAATGQSWTASVYTAVVAGSVSNISAIENTIVERNSAGGFLGESVQAINATNALVRSSISRTFNDATAARTNSQIKISFSSGVAIDITLRIGLPQLEQGAFATSVIPTSGTAVTRSADVASITGTNFSSWYRQDEGTIWANGTAPNKSVTGFRTRGFVSINNGTVSESILMGHSSTEGAHRGSLFVGNVNQFITNPQQTINNVFTASNNYTAKTCITYKANDLIQSANGLLTSPVSSASLPVTDRMNIGDSLTADGYLNGTIRRLTYWPQRLPNETLQQITQ